MSMTDEEFLISDIAQLRNLLADTSPDELIEKANLSHRLAEQEECLALIRQNEPIEKANLSYRLQTEDEFVASIRELTGPQLRALWKMSAQKLSVDQKRALRHEANRRRFDVVRLPSNLTSTQDDDPSLLLLDELVDQGT